MLLIDQHSSRLLGNTFLLVIGTLAIAMPAGCTLAWTLFRTDIVGRRVHFVLLASLLFMPLYLHVAGWQAGFGPQGWLQMGYRGPGTAALLQGWRGAICVHGTAAIPWVTFLVGLGLSIIPRDIEEAALLSAPPFTVATKISFRMAMPALIAAAIWTTVSVSGEMTVTDVFQIRTFAEELFLGFAGNALILQPEEPARLRLLPGVLLVAATTGLALMISATLFGERIGIPQSPPRRFQLGRWRWPTSVAIAAAILCLCAVPLMGLGIKLGTVVEQVGDDRIRTWSLQKAVSLLVTGSRPAPVKYAEEFGWSLAIGNLASLAAVAIGGLLAWKSRTSSPIRCVTVAVVAICFALPGPLVGLGLIRLLNQREYESLTYLYDRTILAPWLAMLVRCLPLTSLVMWHGLRSVPQSVTDAAQVDGASRWEMLRSVIFPLRGKHFLCAWLVGLTVSIGDLATTILVLPPGVSTLSTRIFGLVHYGVEDQLAALSLCAIGLFALLSTVVLVLCRNLRFG